MLKTVRVFILPALLILLVAAGSSIHAQAPDTEETYLAAYDAFNAGDIETGMSYFSEDAVSTILPPPPFLDATTFGREAIGEGFEPGVAASGEWTLTDITVLGDAATFVMHYTQDDPEGEGIYPLRFTGSAVVRNGLIQTESWSMDQASLDKIIRAGALEANRELIRRFYDEIWNEGDMAAADEIVAPDFIDGFTGNNGIDALKDIVGIFNVSFPDFQVAYTDMVAADDVVVVSVEATGTYAGGAPEFLGIPDSVIGENVVIFSGVDFARIEDGQIAEGWGTHDALRTLTGYGYEVVPPAE